jgi:hypothetical protein
MNINNFYQYAYLILVTHNITFFYNRFKSKLIIKYNAKVQLCYKFNKAS